MWGKKNCIVIIPTFLAITHLGQSIYLHLIIQFKLLPPATWLVSAFSGSDNNRNSASYWPNAVFSTGLAASMFVNAVVTGMIVFRILKATGVKPTPVERTLGTTDGNKFRHVIFIIIESGMALFAIQLVRFVLWLIPVPLALDSEQELFFQAAGDMVIVINEMLNVIITISTFLLLLFY